MELKIIVTFVIFTYFLSQVDSKIFAVKKEFEIRSIVKDVIRRTKSEGVFVYHINFAKVSPNKLTYDKWARGIAGLTTVASINSFRNYSKYYFVANRTKTMKECELKHCYCLKPSQAVNPQTLANDRVMIIAIVPLD